MTTGTERTRVDRVLDVVSPTYRGSPRELSPERLAREAASDAEWVRISGSQRRELEAELRLLGAGGGILGDRAGWLAAGWLRRVYAAVMLGLRPGVTDEVAALQRCSEVTDAVTLESVETALGALDDRIEELDREVPGRVKAAREIVSIATLNWLRRDRCGARTWMGGTHDPLSRLADTLGVHSYALVHREAHQEARFENIVNWVEMRRRAVLWGHVAFTGSPPAAFHVQGEAEALAALDRARAEVVESLLGREGLLRRLRDALE